MSSNNIQPEFDDFDEEPSSDEEEEDGPLPSLNQRPVYDSSDEEDEEEEQPAPKPRRLPRYRPPRPAPNVSVPVPAPNQAATVPRPAPLPLPRDGIPLGLAESTKSGWVSGTALWNKVAAKVGLPKMEDLGEDNLRGDQAQTYFRIFCHFVSSNPIPKQSNEDLEPLNPQNKSMLQISTLLQYIGRIMRQMQEKTPNLKDTTWLHFNNKNGPGPKWYTDLLKDCEKNWKRNYHTYWKDNDDTMFGQYDIMPLYSHVGPKEDPEWLHDRSSWYHDDLEEHNGQSAYHQ